MKKIFCATLALFIILGCTPVLAAPATDTNISAPPPSTETEIVPEDMDEVYVTLDDYGYIGEELYAEYDVELDEEEYEDFEAYGEYEYEEEYAEEDAEIYIEEGYIEEDPDAYDETGEAYEEYEEFTMDDGEELTGEIAPPQYIAAYGEDVALRSDMA